MNKIIKVIDNPKYLVDYVKRKFNKKNSKKNFKKKSSAEYMDELLALINAFDVNSLKYKKEYIWPYMRNRLWIQLYGLGNGKEGRRNFAYHAVQRGSFKDLPFKSRKKMKLEYNALEIAELQKKDSQVDFLFLTVINASEQVLLDDGRIYHRITDPFYEIAKNIGKAEKIEILKVKSSAIEKSKKYFHPVTYILSPDVFRMGYIKSIKFGNFLSNIKEFVPSLTYTGDNLRGSIDWELHTRDFYLDILREYKPKVIFLNGFHYHTPLISAADFLGIRSVDIQHGIQVGWNPLYNNWKEMPKEGYQGVPDNFFVWGKKDFNSIEKVFTGEKHTPIVVGFPWLEKQLEITKKLKSEYCEEFKKYKVKTLLILQNQGEVPTLYMDLIKNLPDDHLVVIRHHPKGNKFKIDDFQASKKKNVKLSAYFDNITLAQLFPHIDIVISAGSTVASEADYFGLYNFIFSEQGKNNYVDEIKKGEFFAIDDYQEFYQTLKTLDMNKRESRANVYEKVDIESVLKSFLDNKREKKSA